MDDPVRKAIAKAIKDRGLTMASVSRAMGKNHAYLSEYFRLGKPAQLDYREALKLKSVLNLPMEDMGFPGGGTAPLEPSRAFVGMENEAELAQIGPTDRIKVEPGPGMLIYVCMAPTLANHTFQIAPGDTLLIDTSVRDREHLSSEDAVLVELWDRSGPQPPITILRQFIRPALLITNQANGNAIIGMDDESLPYEPIMIGKITHVLKGHGLVSRNSKH